MGPDDSRSKIVLISVDLPRIKCPANGQREVLLSRRLAFVDGSVAFLFGNGKATDII